MNGSYFTVKINMYVFFHVPGYQISIPGRARYDPGFHKNAGGCRSVDKPAGGECLLVVSTSYFCLLSGVKRERTHRIFVNEKHILHNGFTDVRISLNPKKKNMRY